MNNMNPSTTIAAMLPAVIGTKKHTTNVTTAITETILCSVLKRFSSRTSLVDQSSFAGTSVRGSRYRTAPPSAAGR
jgi:hypothetical protein